MDCRSTENEFSGSEKTFPAASNLTLPARYFAGVRSEIGRPRRRFGLIVCQAPKRSAGGVGTYIGRMFRLAMEARRGLLA